ncbi:MAG: hypothetical protein QG602_3855, partial [Verrucomicrobiota bacterium]|nr:hypothetical protein [Verrucomicrobiota bacterium]
MTFRSALTLTALVSALTLNLAASSAITKDAVMAERVAAESAK